MQLHAASATTGVRGRSLGGARNGCKREACGFFNFYTFERNALPGRREQAEELSRPVDGTSAGRRLRLGPAAQNSTIKSRRSASDASNAILPALRTWERLREAVHSTSVIAWLGQCTWRDLLGKRFHHLAFLASPAIDGEMSPENLTGVPR